MKKIICALLVAAAILTDVSALEPPSVDAKGAFLMELETQAVLFEQNADEKLYPASITKLMTALVVLEKANPEDIVTVKKEGLDGLPEMGSSVFLVPGEQMPLMDLLKYLLVSSGNDAANALAIHIGGTLSDFVAMMNSKAQSLGCTNTQFANAHGLHDEDHYTTARDLSLIAQAAIENKTIAEIVAMPQVKVAATNKHKAQTFTTTNHLISKIKDGNYYYPDAIGIKTGFTTPAGYCLTAAAVKGELTYLSVVLGAVKREDGKIGSFTESIKLLDYAEKNFSVQLVVQSSDPIAEVPVKLSSERDAVVAVPEGSISALLPNDFDRTKLVIDYDVVKSIDAPVTKGQALGNATFSYEGKEYGKLALVAAEDIGRSQVLYVVSRITGFFGSTAFKIIVGVLLSVVVLAGVALVAMRVTNQRRHRRRGGRGKYRR